MFVVLCWITFSLTILLKNLSQDLYSTFNFGMKIWLKFVCFDVLVSVARSFWFKIATPTIENHHKIATEKLLKIATFLVKIPTFVSHSIENWPSHLVLLHFYAIIFWKMWHFGEFFKKSIHYGVKVGMTCQFHPKSGIFIFKKNRHSKKSDRHLTLKIATVAINRHNWSHWSSDYSACLKDRACLCCLLL